MACFLNQKKKAQYTNANNQHTNKKDLKKVTFKQWETTVNNETNTVNMFTYCIKLTQYNLMRVRGNVQIQWINTLFIGNLQDSPVVSKSMFLVFIRRDIDNTQ